MSFNFSPSGIQKLSSVEIIKALNSGIFISATIKNQLRERLSYLEKEDNRIKSNQSYFPTKLSASSPLSSSRDSWPVKISSSSDTIPAKSNSSRKIIMSDYASIIQQDTLKSEPKSKSKIELKSEQKNKPKKRQSISQTTDSQLNEWNIESLDADSLLLINPVTKNDIKITKPDAVIWGQSAVSLDKIRSAISSVKKDDTPIKKDDPPITSPPIIETEPQIIEDLQQSTKKVLNFKKIIDSTIINDMNHDHNSEKLFDNGDLVIDYIEIEKVYKLFAIDRIHMNFLNLDRQVNILNQPNLSDKKSIEYENLYLQKEIMKDCFCSYIEITKIVTIASACRISLQIMSECDGSRLINSTKMISIDKINELRLAFIAIKYPSNVLFKEYVEKIVSIKKLVKEFMSITNTVLIKITQLETIINELPELKDYLATTFDPKIECEYYIEFKRQIGGNIIPKGISSHACHPFGKTTMMAHNQEEYYGDSTKNRIHQLFEYTYRSNTSNIIFIHPPYNSDIRKMHISFTIADDIPFAKGGITIRNKPEDVHTLTSMIVNHKFTTNIPEQLPACFIEYHIDKWYKKQNSSKLSMSIDSDNDQVTTYDTSCSDAIFDQLLEEDVDGDIIRMNMRDSFRKLVYHTS